MTAFLLSVWRMFPIKAWAFVAIIVAGVVLFGVARCEHDRAERAEQGERQAEARTDSAVNAIKEISALEARNQATQAQVEQAHAEIRQADPADRDRVARARLACLQGRARCPW